MAPKDPAKEKSPNPVGKKGKPKGQHAAFSPEPTPPLVITNEKLAHQNWWPVISMVVENSPVETLLVDLMADCVRGNSVVVIRKDDLLQEVRTLLKERATPVSTDVRLSRREQDQIAKKLVAEEVSRKRDAEEKEREAMRLRQAATEKGPQERLGTSNMSNASMSKQQTKSALRTSTDKGPTKVEAPTVVPDPAATPELVPPHPRTLADDLIDELTHHNKEKSLEEVLKEPSPFSFLLLIKYKLMLLKQFDMDLFNLMYPDRAKSSAPPPSPIESRASLKGKKGKDKQGMNEAGHEKDLLTVTKDAKGKPGTQTKMSVLPKDAKAPGGSIVKGKAGSKGKGQPDDAEVAEPPPLQEGEVVREPAYVEDITQERKNVRARARARSEIPVPIEKILKKQRASSEVSADPDEDSARSGLENAIPPADGIVFNEDNGDDAAEEAEAPPFLDSDNTQHHELMKIQQLFLASAMGTEGLPVLNHALSTKLALYGLPTFPALKYQMTRYIVLQGFQDAAIVSELDQHGASLASVVNVQFMRHRNLSPLKMSSLLWVRHPVEQSQVLSKFWSDVRAMLSANPKSSGPPLSALVVQVKHDVSVSTTKKEFETAAKDGGQTLADLLYYVARAKIIFQFYNGSLDLQHVPANRRSSKDPQEHPGIADVFHYLSSLEERASLLPANKTAPPVLGEEQTAVSPLAQEFMKRLELDLFRHGLISELKPDRRAFAESLDSRLDLQQTSRIRDQYLAVIEALSGPGLAADDESLSSVEPAVAMLHKALRNRDIMLQYNVQWIERLFELIKERTAEAPRQKPPTPRPVNPLADAMIAWNVGSAHSPKKSPATIPDYEFLVPDYSDAFLDEPTATHSDDGLSQLARMTTYYAVVTYPTTRLMSEIADASEQYFHRCVRHDKRTGRTFFIFYALHDKTTHTHIRNTETRLHSKADFPTFVCNIMDDIHPWTEKNIEKAYLCPRRPPISPRFPYGCQSQFACQNDYVSQLNSPEGDHMAYFIRKHSLKNLVRLNREIFAKRCGWKMKSAMPKIEPIPETPPLEPKQEFLSPTPTGKKEKPSAKKKKPATEKVATPEKIPPCPPKETSAEEEPFIWNRATDPLLPPCNDLSLPKISAYSLTNALTKANREEERIYCCDMTVSIDRHELFDGTTALYVTANITDGLDVFLTNDRKGRFLSVEYNHGARITVERVSGEVVVNVYDPLGTKTVMSNGKQCICEVFELGNYHNRRSSRGVSQYSTVFFRSGPVVCLDKSGKAKIMLPSGEEQSDSTGTTRTSENSAEEHTTVQPKLAIFRYASSDGKTFASVNSSGIQTAVELALRGAQKRIETEEGLRLTVNFDRKGDRFLRASVAMEKPGYPRVRSFLRDDCVSLGLCCGVLCLNQRLGFYLVFTGVNVMLVTPDGSAYLTKLGNFCKAFQEPEPCGLIGYASPTFLSLAMRLLEKVTRSEDLDNHNWPKFSLMGEYVATVFDLGSVRHDIYDNGEVRHESKGNDLGRYVMPNPRVFVVDKSGQSGSEFVFGDEAVALKYKILGYYAPDRIKLNPNKSKSSRFSCLVFDGQVSEWEYEKSDFMPDALVSDLKVFTALKPFGGVSPKSETFRVTRPNSKALKEQVCKVEFVPEKPKVPQLARQVYYTGPCIAPYIIPAETYSYESVASDISTSFPNGP